MRFRLTKDVENPNMQLSLRGGHRVQFKDGKLQTKDRAVIARLSRHPYVELDEGKAGGSRKELNKAAREAGVADPEKLPNIEAVREAIDAATAG
jgi:hypothetical protein